MSGKHRGSGRGSSGGGGIFFAALGVLAVCLFVYIAISSKTF